MCKKITARSQSDRLTDRQTDKRRTACACLSLTNNHNDSVFSAAVLSNFHTVIRESISGQHVRWVWFHQQLTFV